MSQQIIAFPETATQELISLQNDLRIAKLLEYISPGSPLPDDVKAELRGLTGTLADMFGTSIPGIEEDELFATLQLVTRDLNIGKILRERGLFRLWRMLRTKRTVVDEVTREFLELPAFMLETNPDTGGPFTRQEEFIRWFCREAKVARALVFMRVATLDRMIALGIPEQEAYEIVLEKPFVIREALNSLASWEKGEMLSVDPALAIRIAARALPERAAEVQELAEAMGQTDDLLEQADLQDQLVEMIKPAVANLVREVGAHDNARDAMDFVRHDVIQKPEVIYRWDHNKNHLIVEYIRKAKDPYGTEYVAEVTTIPFIPDIDVLPQAVVEDLNERLPIRGYAIQQ